MHILLWEIRSVGAVSFTFTRHLSLSLFTFSLISTKR
jgi:hypothetical protein